MRNGTKFVHKDDLELVYTAVQDPDDSERFFILWEPLDKDDRGKTTWNKIAAQHLVEDGLWIIIE